MFRQMKLGTKIAFGFTIILLILLALGSWVIWNMGGLQKSTEILIKEKVPEVAICTNLERAIHGALLEIRGYGFTEEKSFLDKGLKSVEEGKKYLKNASDLCSGALTLEAFKKAVSVAEDSLQKYEDLIMQTADKTEELKVVRRIMAENSGIFMKICNDFLDDYDLEYKREVSEGAPADKLLERMEKIKEIISIKEYGNQVIAGAWEAQFHRSPQEFLKIQSSFKDVFEKFR